MLKAKHHMPLILSLFCPGIGQLVQRRWLAGLIYLAIFLALCIALSAVVLKMLATNVDAALAFMNSEPNKDFSTGSKPAMLWLTASLILVHLTGMIDTYAAFKRKLQQDIRDRLKTSKSNNR